jgi:hypothetical protein
LWPEVEIDIITFDTSAGTPDKEVVYAGVKAYKTQKQVMERTDDFQVIGTKMVDVYYVPVVQAGESLVISEDHHVRLDGADRKIIQATDQGGQGEILELLTERAR